jgi:hypothetical protein
VIRNVTVVRFKDGTEEAALERIVNSLLGLQMPGLINLSCGVDAGLRDGNAHLAVVADLEDEAAYRGYDTDPEHNRIRAELIAPHLERIERVQYRI